MKLVVYQDFGNDLETQWINLEKISQYSIFQTYKWLKFWQETIGTHVEKVSPWIIVGQDDDGQPKMIFPFGVRKWFGLRVLEMLGGAQADYQGPLIHEDLLLDPSMVELIWREVAQHLPRHDVKHFYKLPEKWMKAKNPLLSVWPVVFQGNSYSATLPDTFSEFQKRLRSKLRADNNRQRRRLAEKGELSYQVFDDVNEETERAIDVMIKQKQERFRNTGSPDLFADLPVQEFYKNLPINFTKEGRVHFSILKLNNEILATHWGGVYRDRYYFLMPTYDSGEWKVYSPGRLLLENLLEWSIQNSLKIFDFTIGGEDYKKDWCDSVMPLFEHLKVNTPAGLPYFLYIRLRRAARKNEKVWSKVKSLYSWYKYGKKI